MRGTPRGTPAAGVGDEIVIVINGPCQITQTISLAGNRAYRGDSATTLLTEAPGANLAAVLGPARTAGTGGFLLAGSGLGR